MRRLDGAVPFRGGGFVAARCMPVAGGGDADRRWSLLWQAGASAGLIPTLFLPPPLAIARALWRAGGQRRVVAAPVGASLQRLAIGWASARWRDRRRASRSGCSRVARSPGMAVVSALFPIPKIALVPLFIIWFGIGEGSKIATLAFGVFFPTVISTAGGVDDVPRGLIRMGAELRRCRAGRSSRKIVLPGALPAILSGFRVTTSIAIILLVAAEMIGAERGIGAFVLPAGNLYDTDNLLAGIVVLSLLGLARVLGDRAAGAGAAGLAIGGRKT